MALTMSSSSYSHHTKQQPSINSRDFAVSPGPSTHNSSDEDEFDQISTDSYQDSTADEEEEITNTFDSVKYLSETLNNALSSEQFNRSIALQAQTSGNIKSKELELHQLQNEAQERLKQYKMRFKEGLKLLTQVTKDMNWAKGKIELIDKHVSAKYPIEYAQSKERIISRSAELQEIIRQEEARENGEQQQEEEIYI